MAQEDSQPPRINWRRGLWRIWIIGSVCWFAGFWIWFGIEVKWPLQRVEGASWWPIALFLLVPPVGVLVLAFLFQRVLVPTFRWIRGGFTSVDSE